MEGVFGVDEGVENASLPLRKRRRVAMSECATFSDFNGVENQNDGENQNGQNDTTLQQLC